MIKTEYLSYEEVLCRLADAVNAAGSQHAFANQHGFSHAYVSMILRKKRPPGLPILRALGVGREITVRYVAMGSRAVLEEEEQEQEQDDF